MTSAAETSATGSSTTDVDAAVRSAHERRRRRWLSLVAGGALLFSLGGVVGSTFIKSPEQQRAEAKPPDRSVLTSRVERRVLASTVVTRGTVGAAKQIEVTPASAQGAAIAVVTSVRTKPGASLRAGQVALSVSGRPLIILPGAVPAYRDLRPGDDGADVAQLQAALRQLRHYDGGDRKGFFGAATKAAVERLYGKVGFAVPQTGGLDSREEQKSLRAADDAVRVAEREVALIKARIRAEPHATPAPGEPSLQQQLSDAQRTLTAARQDRAELVTTTGPMAPLAELVFVPALPAQVVKLTAKVGDQVEAPLLVVAAGALNVTARLQPEQASLLRPGMAVEIISESLGKHVDAIVADIGDVTTETVDGQSGPPFVPMTIRPADTLTSQWNGLDVRLTVTAAKTDREVLVVPLSAVSASADGRTTVTVAGPDGRQTRVEVRAGASADGFVEVEPVDGTLDAGLAVVVGQ